MLKLMKRKLVLLIQSILYGDEVIVDVTAGENVEQNAKVAEQKVSTADPVTTAGEVVTTAGIEVTTATITPQISKDELTVVGNKMHKAFPLLVRKFPLPEEECHCQKKSVATVRSLHCYHCQRETQDIDQQYPTVAKIHMLDTAKFEQWQFRMQQYLQHEHYALWEAVILKTFGGNEATKKTKKNLLKQQYGNFRAETLEQIFTRLQVII
nr:hypothetical protein [Tanacetum cinerariifolium]